MTTKSLENNVLANKVILVTGASQGLGAEVAKACAAAGATVVLLGRSQKKLEKVYDEVLAAGDVEPFAICFDMMGAQELEFEQLARTLAEATQGKLDGVIHCASYFYALSPLDFQTVAEWVNQYRINTVAPMALTRAVLPLLKESPDASVIFVGESHGETPQAYWGGFGASKAALNYLCKVAADEWSVFRICARTCWCQGLSIRRSALKRTLGKRRRSARIWRTLRLILCGGRASKARGAAGRLCICKPV